MEDARESWLGQATIAPNDPVEAGSLGTWTIRYVTGLAGIDDGGRLRIAWRSVSDWGTPQTRLPELANYLTVATTGDASLSASVGSDGVRPWNRTVTIRVSDGALAQGDVVEIVVGDTRGGGPGARAQTFPERPFRFRFQADPFGAGVYEDVADLGLELTGGPAVRLELVVPSDAVAGEPLRVQARALDRWGNPDPAYRGNVAFSGNVPAGFSETVRFTELDAGVRWFEGVAFVQPGTHVIQARDADGLRGESNPLRCHAAAPERRLYWGDLHGQTEETVGTGSIEDYLAYAREVAAVDATGHQGNDFQITAAVYDQIQSALAEAHEPGRFVTFHGYEWSGNTPAGGDRNVFFLNGGPLHRSSHTLIADRSDADSDRYPVDRLHAEFAGREDALLVPHIGGRHANLDYHDPSLEPVIEIASQWGRFEWFARDALARGLKVGFVGGSDDHSGRPGWSAATIGHHGVRGGLTAFIASELTRESLWEALRARRCYGTTGERIIIEASVSGHPIGAEFVTTEAPAIHCHVVGTADIETIELRRGLETIHVEDFLPLPRPGQPQRLRVAWRGARNRGRGRALDWTGELTVSGGRITGVRNYGVDNPLEGVTAWDETSVAWRSHTVGDWDGVTLDLDGDDETTVAFTSPTMAFSVALGEIGRLGHHQPGDLLEQRVLLRRFARRSGRRAADLEWTDMTPRIGVNPYWLWITQSDGEMAWTSPVFVEVRDE